jgi:hypothetical protein
MESRARWSGVKRLCVSAIFLLLTAATTGFGAEQQVSSQRLADLPVIGSAVVSLQALAAYISFRHPRIDPIYLAAIYRAYRDECRAEDVNLAVALAQMIHETDHLLFTGSVEPTQYNFAGLGVTGDGACGASFFDVRTGVRAHVQHLKAYGDSEALSRPVVDTRFGLVTRGSAPTVELLTGRWATDPEYGQKILMHAYRLLALTTGAVGHVQ